jgi:hypothetical protein
MITKILFLLLMLPLVLCIAVKHDVAQMPGRNNSNKSVKQQTGSSEFFKVSRDTVYVNIDGRLSRGLLIHNKYYCLYEVRDPMSTCSNKKFYIFKKNGKIVREIKVPEAIHVDTYPKLYYLQDRLIVNTEFYKSTYYLDEDKGQFVKSPVVIEVPLFEDERYQVTSKCHGEFGSTIYFKNKSTRVTDSAYSGCPVLVNKLGDKYFVNTFGTVTDDIIEINNPGAITIKTIFSRDRFVSHFFIPTSFVAKGNLYHIYNSHQDEFRLDEKQERVVISKDTAKIGTITDSKFIPVYTFKDRFDIGLQQQLSPNYQICTFHTEQRLQIGFKKDIPPYRESKYGFLEIMGNEIRIHYFFSKKVG